MQSKKLSVFAVIGVAFRQMGTIYQTSNPMFLLAFITSCFALVIFSKQIFYKTDQIFLYAQMTFWLWMIIFLSSLVESVALRGHDNFHLKKIRKSRVKLLKKLRSDIDIHNYDKVKSSKIKAGDLILLETGDEIPFDGEVLQGMCYLSESEATGFSENRLKSPSGDNVLIAGSFIESNDWIIMKVSFASKKSFFVRVFKLLQHIERQAMPSEMAFERLMLGLSILFIAVVFSIWVIADYSGLKLPLMYLINLIVILLPTTISGLQKAIIFHSHANLAASGIKVQDQVAFDNAADINVVLIDKTGTLTIGQREMVEFIPLSSSYNPKEYLRYIYLSSLEDDTHEGKSIISFVSKRATTFSKRVGSSYEYLPFSASNPISGCNYRKCEIRKGSLKAVAKYLGKTVKTLPQEVQKIASQVAKTYGTALVLTVDKAIIGVINLQDRVRRGVAKQIKAIQEEGMQVAIITGDSELTTAYLAKELGVKNFYADCTPEKKFDTIRHLQKMGYVVAMCGDGVNDALALAQADIGYTFAHHGHTHAALSSNIVSQYHDLSGLLELKKECQEITIKRGGLTVYSVTSDLAKYFVIVPALFTTVFPTLSHLNIMQFKSVESVVLSSLIFNALSIPSLAPLIFYDRGGMVRDKPLMWNTIIIYGLGGVISPFLFIKLIEIIIYKCGLV